MGRLRTTMSRWGPMAAVATVALTLTIGACAPGDSPGQGGLLEADSMVRDWVESGRIPGAVLLVSHEGEVELLEAYGHSAAMTLREGESEPRPLERPIPMSTSTVFDLASVTKVMATTMAAMLLVDRGGLDLDEPVSRYLPDFVVGGKAEITIRHLLTHRSGLSQWQPTYYHASSADEAYAWIRDFPLQWPVGEGRHYSDLGFMVLGRVVESVTATSLDDFLTRELYSALGLVSTGFTPVPSNAMPSRPAAGSLGAPGSTRFAATSHGNPFERRMVHDMDFGYPIAIDPESWSGWRNYTLAGEVNDGNAHHAFRGVAGHAGLFSTVEELHVLLQLLLNGGTYDGTRFLSANVVELFMQDSGDGQALGWQLPAYGPAGAFGHTGFTGTFVLGVPASNTGVVLLTNRQNFGVDDDTQYPDIGALQLGVTEAVTRR